MIRLGIDQSFTSTGIVVSYDEEIIHHEIISTAKDKEDPMTNFKRAEDISTRIASICLEHNVEETNIEGLGFGSVGDATRNLAGLQYLIVSKLIGIGMHIRIVPPTALKKFATGSGKAKKEEMFEYIKASDPEFFLELSKVKKTKGRYDLADAYWLAIYEDNNNAT